MVYATLPEFNGAAWTAAAGARASVGDLQHTCFVMAGAGIKEGVHLQQQVRQVDVAPTLAYVTGLPRPTRRRGRGGRGSADRLCPTGIMADADAVSGLQPPERVER